MKQYPHSVVRDGEARWPYSPPIDDLDVSNRKEPSSLTTASEAAIADLTLSRQMWTSPSPSAIRRASVVLPHPPGPPTRTSSGRDVDDIPRSWRGGELRVRHRPESAGEQLEVGYRRPVVRTQERSSVRLRHTRRRHPNILASTALRCCPISPGRGAQLGHAASRAWATSSRRSGGSGCPSFR